MLNNSKPYKQKGHQKERREEVVAEEPRPRIPLGTYDAVCFDMNIKQSQGGAWKVYLNFRICGGEYDGTELFMCCPKPNYKLRERHKLHKQMSLALGRTLYKGERLSKKIFIKKMYKVLVRDTHRRYQDTNKVMPDFMQYSVVRGIIEASTGVSDET